VPDLSVSNLSVGFAESPTAIFSLFVPSDSVGSENPCIFMIPVRIPEGRTPRILALIDGITFPLLLDTGGEVRVLPLNLFRRFNQSAEQLASSRSISTFGNGVVQLYGPVPLSITLCGVSLTHAFYLVDDRAVFLSPALGGYDLMKAAHLVLDVPNGLAWSRLTQSPLESQVPSPNPSTAQLPSSEFGPSMSFVREMCYAAELSEVAVSGCPSAEEVVVSGCPSAEEVVVSGHPSAEEVVVSGTSSVKDVVVSASSPLSSDLLSSESVSHGNSSSVLSRQVSVVLPTSHCGHISTASSRVDPRVPPFQSRSRSCTWKEPSPSLTVDTTSSLAYWPHTSHVGFNDETLVKTPFCSESVCTLDSQDLTVPTHLQDLFDQTVQHASLSLSTQQDLAAKECESIRYKQVRLGVLC